MNVNEVMSPDMVTCHVDTNLEQVARLMWDHDCGAVPVINRDGRPIGIVTDRDIAMAAMHNHQPLWELQAHQLIQGQHLCCSHQEDDIHGCLTKMEQNGVRRILVTNADGTLCGIVSMGDILAYTSGKPKAKGMGMDEVLDMLQHVSGHHAAAGGPIVTQ